MEISVRGGRKPVRAMVDGELVIIKKVSKFGNTQAIFLPREWILALELLHGKEPTHYTMTYTAEALILKPYCGKEVK